DETSKDCKYIATTPHYLESWGDVQFSDTDFSLIQPTIQTLFNTRQFQESLLTWADNDSKYYDYLRENWQENILGDGSWKQALHDGIYSSATSVDNSSDDGDDEDSDNDESSNNNSSSADAGTAARNLVGSAKNTDGFELTLYTSTGLG